MLRQALERIEEIERLEKRPILAPALEVVRASSNRRRPASTAWLGVRRREAKCPRNSRRSPIK